DQPGIVVIEGPPGIGKTRLATEVAARLRADNVKALMGSCPRDGGSSVAAVADIVRGSVAAAHEDRAGRLDALAPLVPDLVPDPRTSPDPAPEIRRLQLFDAASQALASVEAPVLVVVD